VSFGISPWGLGPWGGVDGFYLSNAYCLDSQTVVAVFNTKPRQLEDDNAADAVRASAYTLAIASSKLGQAPPRVPDLLSARRDPSDENNVLIRLSTDIGPPSVEYVLGVAATVKSDGGQTIGARSSNFFGLLVVKTAAQTLAKPLQDVRYEFATEGELSGVLRYTASGDLATSEASVVRRKLVLRRLIVAPGEFVWDPTFGVDIATSELVRPSSFPALERRITEQLKLEPEVDQVKVRITRVPGQGVVYFDIRIKWVDGTEDNMTFKKALFSEAA